MKEQGMLGYWPLTEESGSMARDASGNGRDGVVVGATAHREGPARCRFFGGLTDRIEVPDHESLRLGSDITIAAWIWKHRANKGERWDAILAKSPNKWDYELLTSKSRSDELAFYSPTCLPNEVYGNVPVPVGSWQHVAVTRAGSRVSFYLNGRVTSEVTMTGTFPVTGGSLLIGHDGVEANGMIGLIREVCLFRRALDPGEVRTLGTGALPGV